jgi:hypothetical protein
MSFGEPGTSQAIRAEGECYRLLMPADAWQESWGWLIDALQNP